MRRRTELMFQVETVSFTEKGPLADSFRLRQICAGGKREALLQTRIHVTENDLAVLVSADDGCVFDVEHALVDGAAPLGLVEYHDGLEALRVHNAPLI